MKGDGPGLISAVFFLGEGCIWRGGRKRGRRTQLLAISEGHKRPENVSCLPFLALAATWIISVKQRAELDIPEVENWLPIWFERGNVSPPEEI